MRLDRVLFAFLYTIMVSFALEGFSQNLAEKPVADIKLSNALEKRIEEILGKHVPVEKFHVSVNAVSSEPLEKGLPYLPKGISTRALHSMSLEQLRSRAIRLTLDLGLDQEVTEQSSNALQQFLRSKLRLNEANGDTLNLIAFTPFEVAQPVNPVEQFNQEYQRSLAEITQLNNEVASLNRERSDVAQKLAITEQELAKSNTEKVDLERKEQEASKNLSENEAELKQLRAEQDSWTRTAVYGLAGTAGMLVLVLILATFVFAKSFGNFGSSVKSLGETIKEGLVSQSRENELPSDSEVASTSSVEAPGIPHQAPSPEIQSTLLKLNEEVLSHFKEESFLVLLNYCKNGLQRPDDVSGIVAVLEFLGPKISNRVYQDLDAGSKAIVMDFLKRPVYPYNKWNFMLDKVEIFRTMLLRPIFTDPNFDPDIDIRLLVEKLSDEQVLILLSQVDHDISQRLMLYLDPNLLAGVLESMHHRDQTSWKGLLQSLCQIHEAAEKSQDDLQLKSAIEAVLAEEAEDTQSRWLPYYRKIMGQLPASIASKSFEEIRNFDPQFEQTIRKELVIYEDLFELNILFQERIVSNLSNRDLALVCSFAEPERVTDVKGILNSQRKIVLEEELETVASLTQAKKKRQFEVVMKKVVDKIISTAAEEGGLAVLKESIEEVADSSISDSFQEAS